MNKKYYSKVREYLLELEYTIVKENPEEEIFIVEKEENGIVNLILDCNPPVLLIEQVLFEIKKDDVDIYKALLQKNCDVIHGAFALDSSGKLVLFRDTLELENLDLNELEGSLNSISILLSEFGHKILAYSKLG